jgi:hypothetical protein
MAAPPRRPSDPAPATLPARREGSGPFRKSELPPPAPLPRTSPKATQPGADPSLDAITDAITARTPRTFVRHDDADEPQTTRRETVREHDALYNEETATSRRPAEPYEKWLAASSERDLDDVPTASMEVGVPKRKPVLELSDLGKRADKLDADGPFSMRASDEVSVVDVPVVEVESGNDMFDSDPVVESHLSDGDENERYDFQDEESPLDQTRNGPLGLGGVRAYGSQPAPLAPASSPAFTTPTPTHDERGHGPSGFVPAGPMTAPMGQLGHGGAPPQVQVNALRIPSAPAPMQPQIQSFQAPATGPGFQAPGFQAPGFQAPATGPGFQPLATGPSFQPQMQASMQAPMRAQASLQYPAVSGPVLTPGARAPEGKSFNRAPWFCLGLMVGVAAMVAAFFMPAAPAHGEPTASSPPKVAGQFPGQVGPQAQMPQVQPGQMQPSQMQPGQMQPGQMQPGQMQPGQMQPGQMQPGQMQPGAQAQGGVMQPSAPPTQTQAPQAPVAAAAGKPMPTVDVRTLPIAGQKTAQATPARRSAPRPQPARRAPAPKPLADDDDAPSAAPAAPKPADTVSSDVFLQAL